MISRYALIIALLTMYVAFVIGVVLTVVNVGRIMP
jgi:hypothetical protein